MERGGGELADKVEAGLVKDLSEAASETIDKLGGAVNGWQVDGKTYSLPFSLGVVGFWYNTELFEEAGITEAPTTMDDLYDAIDKLKAAGIDPISVGAGDKWPAAHYWYYFALRQCSQDVLSGAVTSLDFSDECFVRAGEDLEELVAALLCFVGHIGQARGFAGEELLADQAELQGVEIAPKTTPEQFAALLQEDIAKWARVVKSSGATVD